MRRRTGQARSKSQGSVFFGAPEETRFLKDGLYHFNYWIGDSGDQAKGRGLCVLRAGSVLGSDECGGVFMGSYRLACDGVHHDVAVDLKLPPFGDLVTGQKAGPTGAGFRLTCTIEAPDAQALAVVFVEGVPVAVELVYIGAVPTT